MALLSQRHLDPVVPIAIRRGQTSFEFIASGFAYGLEVEDNRSKRVFHFIATNRHVVENQQLLSIRQNYASHTHISMHAPREAWYFHPNPEIDVAVLPYVPPDPNERAANIPPPYNNRLALPRKQLSDAQFGEGDEVFVLGFPLAMVPGGHRNYTIVRQGVVARIQDWYDQTVESFLIDALVFPGNSGGPVLTKPTNYGTRDSPIDHAYLIGMVSEYVAYKSTVQGIQAQPVGLDSIENTGLAQVIPIETIEETMKLALMYHSAGFE